MSKKTNTLLFILGATVFNIFVTAGCFAGLLLIYARFIAPRLPPEGQVWVFPVIFIAAVILSFVIYRKALKRFMKKIQVDQYFEAPFGGGAGKTPPENLPPDAQ
jgi:surface polysaccharide O-acyltransferase-like enzyme